MSPDVLARLRKEAEQPAGIAPVMCCSELKQLLEERAELLEVLSDLCDHIDEETDIEDGRDGHPRPNWAMRLCNRFGERTNAALTRAGRP